MALQILKIIGIVLLCIVGAALLLALLFLFVPVTYKIEADGEGKDIRVRGRLRAFAGLLGLKAEVGDSALSYQGRFLFFSLFKGEISEKDIKGKASEAPEEDSLKNAPLTRQDKRRSRRQRRLGLKGRSFSEKREIKKEYRISQRKSREERKEALNSKTFSEKRKYRRSLRERSRKASKEQRRSSRKKTRKDLEEINKETRRQQTKKELEEGSLSSLALRAAAFIERKFNKLLIKAGAKLTEDKREAFRAKREEVRDKSLKDKALFWAQTLKEVWEMLKKMDYVWKAPVTKRALRFLKASLLDLLSRIKPKKIKGRFTFGMEEPSVTAKYYALLSLVLGAAGADLVLVPDFEDKKIEAEDICVSGRISAAYMLLSALKIMRNKDVKRVSGYIRRNF